MSVVMYHSTCITLPRQQLACNNGLGIHADAYHGATGRLEGFQAMVHRFGLNRDAMVTADDVTGDVENMCAVNKPDGLATPNTTAQTPPGMAEVFLCVQCRKCALTHYAIPYTS